MIRTAFTKPESQTQQEAQQSVTIVRRILAQYDLSIEEWLDILFETGCQFVENRHCNPAYRKELLQNEHRNFSANWMNSYIQDDVVLLSDPVLFAGDYRELKQQMANPYK